MAGWLLLLLWLLLLAAVAAAAAAATLSPPLHFQVSVFQRKTAGGLKSALWFYYIYKPVHFLDLGHILHANLFPARN